MNDQIENNMAEQSHYNKKYLMHLDNVTIKTALKYDLCHKYNH